MNSFIKRAKEVFEDIRYDAKLAGGEIDDAIKQEKLSHRHLSNAFHTLHNTTDNRHHSFAPQRTGNSVKYHVDGCGYFYAVSEAIQKSQSEILIMDWWLSPELYLRRPPSKNENFRLDRMLKAAAERGVKINIIIYKEVPNVLTLNSAHTKHSLEALHDNISCFRHPDHNPSPQVMASKLLSDLHNISLRHKSSADVAQTSSEAPGGINDNMVLYWAHHEKMCMVDGKIVFCGGLDLCFGRWDTHQHQIA